MQARLQKIIAGAGVCSRREAEELIRQGLVTVNGAVVSDLGAKADPEVDYVKVKGKLITRRGPPSRKRYLAFNKPRYCVTTLQDPQKRSCVKDFIPEFMGRVFPVGRLDYEAEGLLLITNDGDFMNIVTHPSYEVPKTYRVKVSGEITETAINRLIEGVILDDGRARAVSAGLISRKADKSWIEMTVIEGRNRMVKRMCEKLGHMVDKLKRVRIGNVQLGDMTPGTLRDLTRDEVDGLMRYADPSAPRPKIPVHVHVPRPVILSSRKVDRPAPRSRPFDKIDRDRPLGKNIQGRRGRDGHFDKPTHGRPFDHLDPNDRLGAGKPGRGRHFDKPTQGKPFNKGAQDRRGRGGHFDKPTPWQAIWQRHS
jgi:23S rRNA pseudouridine2605 synthase